MRLSDRIKAIEQRSGGDQHGVIVVRRFETVADALKRVAVRQFKGVIIVPEKDPV